MTSPLIEGLPRWLRAGFGVTVVERVDLLPDFVLSSSELLFSLFFFCFLLYNFFLVSQWYPWYPISWILFLWMFSPIVMMDSLLCTLDLATTLYLKNRYNWLRGKRFDSPVLYGTKTLPVQDKIQCNVNFILCLNFFKEFITNCLCSNYWACSILGFVYFFGETKNMAEYLL